MSALVLALETSFRGSWSAPGLAFAAPEAYLTSLSLIVMGGLVAMRLAGLAMAGRRCPSLGSCSFPKPRSRPSTQSSVPGSSFLDVGFRDNPIAARALRQLGPRRFLTPLEWLTVLAAAGVLGLAMSRGQKGDPFMTACLLIFAVHVLIRIRWCLAATSWLWDLDRSGGLEVLLTTPISDFRILHAHHQSLRHHGRPSLVALLGLNLATFLASTNILRSATSPSLALASFGLLFVGGMLVTLADSVCIPWLGLHESLRRGSRIQVMARCFGYLVSVPWVGFAIVMVMGSNASESWLLGGLAFWIAGSLAWDLVIVGYCQRKFASGLRFRSADFVFRWPGSSRAVVTPPE